MVEQLTLNQLVPGSSPGGRTSLFVKALSFQPKSSPRISASFSPPPERLPRRAVRGAGAHSLRFVQLLPRYSLPHWFCGVAAASFFDAASACLLVCGGLSGDAGALAIRSAEQPGGWGQCGGGLLRHEPPFPPPHSTLEDRLPIYDGGAQDFISTGSNHRRRNRSPAWLLAPRSAQRSRR